MNAPYTLHGSGHKCNKLLEIYLGVQFLSEKITGWMVQMLTGIRVSSALKYWYLVVVDTMSLMRKRRYWCYLMTQSEKGVPNIKQRKTMIWRVQHIHVPIAKWVHQVLVAVIHDTSHTMLISFVQTHGSRFDYALWEHFASLMPSYLNALVSRERFVITLLGQMNHQMIFGFNY